MSGSGGDVITIVCVHDMSGSRGLRSSLLSVFMTCLMQGGDVITIVFGSNNRLREDAHCYVALEGSTERHVTTAWLAGAYTLRAITPRMCYHLFFNNNHKLLKQ